MSNSVSHVESPKADASSGQLDGLEYQALASVQIAAKEIAQVEDAQSKAAGAEVEEGRKAAGANTGNAEGRLAIDAITHSLGGGAEIACAIGDVVTDRASDPAKQVDTAKISKQTGGVIGSGKTTSFEKMFKDMKKGPSVIERTGLASSSVGGQKETNVPSSLSKDSVGAMQQTKQVAMTCGIANEKVLGQIQSVRATPQGPSMGGHSPAMTMASGPSFNKKPYQDSDTGEETWMGA